MAEEGEDDYTGEGGEELWRYDCGGEEQEEDGGAEKLRNVDEGMLVVGM